MDNMKQAVFIPVDMEESVGVRDIIADCSLYKESILEVLKCNERSFFLVSFEGKCYTINTTNYLNSGKKKVYSEPLKNTRASYLCRRAVFGPALVTRMDSKEEGIYHDVELETVELMLERQVDNYEEDEDEVNLEKVLYIAMDCYPDRYVAGEWPGPKTPILILNNMAQVWRNNNYYPLSYSWPKDGKSEDHYGFVVYLEIKFDNGEVRKIRNQIPEKKLAIAKQNAALIFLKNIDYYLPEDWTDEDNILTTDLDLIEMTNLESFESLDLPVDDIFDDKNLLRKVIKEGAGLYPKVGDTVLYRCYLAMENGDEIENRFLSPLKTKIGLNATLPFIDMCLSKMKVGETCLVFSNHRHAFQELGLGPERRNSNIICLIQLTEIKPYVKSRLETAYLSYTDHEERMAIVSVHLDNGAIFKSKNQYKLALDQYDIASRILPYQDFHGIETEIRHDLYKIIGDVYYELGALSLQVYEINEMNQVIDSCDRSIHFYTKCDFENPNVYLIKAMAHSKKQDFKEAKEAFMSVYQNDLADPQLVKQTHTVFKTLKKQYDENKKKIYNNLFRFN